MHLCSFGNRFLILYLKFFYWKYTILKKFKNKRDFKKLYIKVKNKKLTYKLVSLLEKSFVTFFYCL